MLLIGDFLLLKDSEKFFYFQIILCLMNMTKSIAFTSMVFSFLAAALVVLAPTQTSTVFAQSSQEDTDAVSTTVNAGGNGSGWDKYSPKNITINAGESVKWVNPMPVSEPHTVTFFKDPNML